MNRRRSALLISPPIYDTQYWAHWSLPYGLLRVASWLKTKGYLLKLIDCQDANKDRTVTKKMRKVRKLCSTEEFVPERWNGYSPPEDCKIEYCFGLPAEELKKRLEAIKARVKSAKQSLFDTTAFPEPDEIWIIVDHDVLVGEHPGRDQGLPRGVPQSGHPGRGNLPDTRPRSRDGEARLEQPAPPSRP